VDRCGTALKAVLHKLGLLNGKTDVGIGTGREEEFIMRGIFMTRLLPFDEASLGKVPHFPGIYIVYKQGPFYVGRSRTDMHLRLWKHLHGLGSRRIAVERQAGLWFEFCETWSPEQAEAILIRHLGTYRLGNLRRESDPADWL
jgi:hypothetical protein